MIMSETNIHSKYQFLVSNSFGEQTLKYVRCQHRNMSHPDFEYSFYIFYNNML